MQRTNRGRIVTSALGMACFLSALFGVANAQSLAVAVGFLLLFGLGWGIFDCNNIPILCRVVRPDLRATAYGVRNLASISCGGFADYTLGVPRDQQVPLNGIFGGFAAVASALLASPLLLDTGPSRVSPRADLSLGPADRLLDCPPSGRGTPCPLPAVVFAFGEVVKLRRFRMGRSVAHGGASSCFPSVVAARCNASMRD